ncbi:GNAT family N-acetyltransferase [Paeniglutamicibacter sp. NPDC012692]|uniref:GNAT family N-acetyltransferase n=1 Tax=Paeniglutamicibacter sp. NPDC012692 TaxID=3364388 RepID=UPI00369D53F1
MTSQLKDVDQHHSMKESNVPGPVSDSEYEAAKHVFPPSRDPKIVEWKKQLTGLSTSEVSIREATELVRDGRRLGDLQRVCHRMPIRDVKENATEITERLVLLAEIDGVHVGFCVASPGLLDSDPLFIREVAVVQEAQRLGIGLELLAKAADRGPRRDIALATQDDNAEARAMNAKFATSIGASIGRVNLNTYRDCDLGIRRGLGYRAWLIQRQPVED